MAAERTEASRRHRRFRPSLEGILENRALLSALGPWSRGATPVEAARSLAPERRAALENFAGRAAAQPVRPNWNLLHQQWLEHQQRLASRWQRLSPPQQRAWGPGSYQTLTFNGGRGVRVIDPQGEAFDVHIVGTGTVQAVPLHDGTIKLVVNGSTPATELLIDPARPTPRFFVGKDTAHTFHPVFGIGDEILPVGQIDVLSGRIGQISGFRTVNLYGPIYILDAYANPDDGPGVDRIALNAMLPGSSIHVANDLNTLDIFTSAELIGEGSGVFVGRDFHWSHVRGDLKLGDGGQIVVGRDFGSVAQPGKGTGLPGQGLLVEGDVLIDASSIFVIQRNLAGPIAVRGNFLGTGQVIVDGEVVGSGSLTVVGEATQAPAPVVESTIPPPSRR